MGLDRMDLLVLLGFFALALIVSLACVIAVIAPENRDQP
jgi:hypothetical protein